MSYQAQPVHLDYLVVRYYPPAPVDIRAIAYSDANITLLNGVLQSNDRNDRQQIMFQHKIGWVSNKHGAIHLDLTGDFWRTPTPVETAQAIHAQLLAHTHAQQSSIPRADFSAWFTFQPDADRIAQLHNATLLVADQLKLHVKQTQGFCTEHHSSEGGYTAVLGLRGRDPSKIRTRSPYIRIYWKPLAHGNDHFKVEIELKKLPNMGDAQLQLQHAHDLAVMILQPLDPRTHAEVPLLQPAAAPGRHHADATTTIRRIAGSAYGYAIRNELDVELLITPLQQVALLLRADMEAVTQMHKKALDNQAKIISAGGSVTVTTEKL